MSKIKKIILAVLSVICLISSVGLIACNNNGGELKLDTRVPQVKYYTGYNVDMFDLFVQEGGYTYAFSVTKTGETEAESTSRFYFVSEAGEYKAACTASKGEQSITKEVTFDVYDAIPYMVMAKNSVVVDWMKRDSLANIFAYSQARILTENAYEEVIDYVNVYDKEDGSARKIDLTSSSPSECGMWDGSLVFTFKHEGKYEFHLKAESTGGATDGMLTVTAVENYKKYPEAETNITIDYDTRVASWTPVVGAASYRIKIGTVATSTTATTLDIKPFLEKEFQNFDFVVIAVDEAGKVIGKKIYENVIIAPEGYEGIVLSGGAVADISNDTVSLPPVKAGIHSVDGLKRVSTNYLGYAGEYGIGYFVDFYFTGNNLPQVCLFANDLSTNITNSDGGKGILIMNGMSSGNSPELLMNSLRAFGPNRLDDPYNHGNLFVLHANNGYEQFGKEYLSKDENANNRYKYVVGSEESASGNVILCLQLWRVNKDGSEELVYLVNKETKVKVSEVAPGNIIAYAGHSGTDIGTEFTFCRKPYSYAESGIISSGAVFTTNGEVWLAGKSLGSSSQPFTIIPGAQSAKGEAYGMSNSFVGIQGEYGVGTYIDTYFTGNNMPEVMFFADKINGNMSGYTSYVHQDPYLGVDSGEKGVIITNGFLGGIDANDSDDRFSVWGPNRIHLGEGGKLNNTMKIATDKALLKITDADENYGMLVQSNLAKEEYANTEFKYTAGTYEVSGKLGIHIKLYEIKGEEEVLLVEYIAGTSLDVSELEAGSIVLYGTVKGNNELTKFTYSEPYEDKPEYLVNDAIKNADGSFSLGGRKLGSSSQPFGIVPNAYNPRGDKLGFENSYLAFDGEYGVGTYIDFTFTGNNMPEVMFFADNINGNMSGYSEYLHEAPYLATASGEKGVIITNGFKGGVDANDTDDRFTVWGPNRIHLGEGVDFNRAFKTVTNTGLINIEDTDPNFGMLTQKVISEQYADAELKYTVGTFEVGGQLGVHVALYEIVDGEEILLTEYVGGTTVKLSEIEAGAIVIYGTVKGAEEATTFSVSEPYDGEPPYIANGASVAMDGTITTNGTVTGNRMYDLANVNNNYYALEGEYGVGTYVDAYFTGNNMPEIMMFASAISGNMTGFETYTYVTGSNDWSQFTLSGQKGLLFSNGFAGGANNNGAPDKFTVWGMDKVFSTTGLAAGLRDATSGALKIFAKETAEAQVLSQLSLEEKFSETPFKYTVGTYADGEYMAVEIILANAETGEEYIFINFTTEVLVADVVPGSIIFYDSVKGIGTTTVFKAGEPYTFGEEGHVHEYTELKTNDCHHWYECSCGKWEPKEDHVGGEADCDTKATCEICQAQYGDYKHEFNQVESEGDYHWYKCECGVTTEKEAHYGGIATTVQKAKCEVCGEEHGELIPEGAITTSKATENEDGSYTLEGGASVSAGASAVYAIDLGYVAIQGAYAAGYFVDFEFTGNNLPQVMFFADNINGRISSYAPSGVNGEKGLLVSNGVFSTSINNNFKDLHHNVEGGYVVGGMYLSAFGPNKIDNNMITLLQTDASRLKRVLSTDTILTYKGLESDTSNRTYIYKVGTILDSDNTVIACAELYDKATGTLLATANVDTTIASADLPAGNIIAYAGIKGEGKTTTFKVGTPYLGEFKNFTSEAKIADDGSIILTAKTMTASGQPFAFISGYAAPVSVSHFGIKGEYGVGTYVDFTFTGNNMPEVMLFASHINGWITGYKDYSGGKAATSGEKGLLISNGIGCTAIPARGTDKYFTVWGMNKLFFGDGAAVNGVFVDKRNSANVVVPHTDANYALLTQEVLASAQYANTNFKCTIGTYEEGDELGLHIMLYDVTSGEEVQLLEYKQTTKIKLTEVTAGSIIFYDSMKGSDTVFKIGEIREPAKA